MPAPAHLLAMLGESPGDYGVAILPVLGLIALFAVGGFLLVAWVGRMVRRPPSDAGGFTLGDLRELHAAGDLTDAEFQAARDALVAKVKKQATTVGKGAPYTPGKDRRKNG